MNDPRESKAFLFGGVSGRETIPERFSSPEFLEQLQSLTNSILRENVRVFCATAERLDDTSDGYWGRGFARARNWAQYADAHSGAVLVLDRDVLVKEAEDAEGIDELLHSPVHYIDRTVQEAGDDVRLGFEAEALAERDPGVIIRGWRDTYRGHLYFEKALDWASEQEYRLVAFAEGSAEVPMARALRAIILGENFPIPERNILATRLARLEVSRLSVMRMSWENGQPVAIADGDSYPGFFKSQWSQAIIPLSDGQAPPPENILRSMCPECGALLVRTDANREACSECSCTVDRRY